MTVKTRFVTFAEDGSEDATDWKEFETREEAEEFNTSFEANMSPLIGLLAALAPDIPTHRFDYEEVA